MTSTVPAPATNNLIELAQRALGRFLPPSQLSIARLSTPADLRAQLKQLAGLEFGGKWNIFGKVRAADFLLEGKYCIALTFGLSAEQEDELLRESEGTLAVVDIPGAIYLYLCDRLDLRKSIADTDRIEDEIAGPALEKDGVELDVIKQFLEPVTVLTLGGDSVFEPSTSAKYVGNYVATFYPRFSNCCVSPTALSEIRKLFLGDKSHLVEANFFAALESSTPRHAFLEVYRTLEFVFVLPRARSLLGKLNDLGSSITIDAIELARHCYTELGWKRVERDSLERLLLEFARNDGSAFTNLRSNCSVFADMAPVTPEDPLFEDQVKKIAGKYYSVRNQVVHQLWPSEERVLTDADWSQLVDFTVSCISYLYSRPLQRPKLLAAQA